jgi:hypothetical protein
MVSINNHKAVGVKQAATRKSRWIHSHQETGLSAGAITDDDELATEFCHALWLGAEDSR